MNNAFQDSSTVGRSGFCLPEGSETSRSVRGASIAVMGYVFHSEASSAALQGVRAAADQYLSLYEAYRTVADSDAEGTSAGISSLMVVPGWSTEVEEPDQPLAASWRNEAAIALLESWLAAPDTGEDNEQLEAFIEAIDEDRLSERKRFP